jgi:virginiamycin A acetyltransferase
MKVSIEEIFNFIRLGTQDELKLNFSLIGESYYKQLCRTNSIKYSPSLARGAALFEFPAAVDSHWANYGEKAKMPRSFIGSYSYINEFGVIRDRTLIGRYCSIGRRVSIAAGIHSLHTVSTSPWLTSQKKPGYSKEQISKVYIKHPADLFTEISSDVWIGDGSIIMPGIKIAVGSVIGANSVVTKNTEPYGIYAGCPARLIRKRFSEDVIDRLIDSAWWNFSREVLLGANICNVFSFIEEINKLRAANEGQPQGRRLYVRA